MEYPYPIMQKSDLRKMGFPEKFLVKAYNSRGQTFAGKIDPTKKTSPILYDTAGLEKYRINQIRMEKGGRP